MRPTLYGLFARSYGVNLDEMIDPIESYPRFVDFFTRRVKPREISKSESELVSPADSRVLTFTEITSDQTLLIKDVNYSLGELLTGQKNIIFKSEDLEKIKKNKENKLYSVIFYLSPGDYHRYHSPVTFNATKRAHIVGHLWPVKIDYISKKPVRKILKLLREFMKTTKECVCSGSGRKES
jgi:phosphatidylserine decarboxylase